MKLIVGLGNPGRGYAHNRHNAGFICLNYFAKTEGIRLDKKQCQARTGIGEVAGNNVVVARPQTFMNLSGKSVARLINKFAVNHDDLLVIHDDLDLPLGRIRIRSGGGSGGHRGVDSIISELGSPGFVRIRVGIGRPQTSSGSPEICEADISAYVLSDFSPEEKQIITQLLLKVDAAIITILSDGLTAAMNSSNQA
ncbi:aminoacyl-tRNA hydrolase [Chloroflexota bacterium]